MSGGNVSHKMTDRVLRVLPTKAPGLTYQAVHSKIGEWSVTSVKHAIRQLREEGLVVREGSHQQPEFRRVDR